MNETINELNVYGFQLMCQGELSEAISTMGGQSTRCC